MADHNDFGKLAEELAENFLVEKNYKILAKNYRYLKAEIDIIAQFENQIVIVSSRGEDHYNSRLESFVFLIDVSNDDLEKMKMNLQKIHSNLLEGVYGEGEFVK